MAGGQKTEAQEIKDKANVVSAMIREADACMETFKEIRRTLGEVEYMLRAEIDGEGQQQG